jgi:predicted glycosyltransferase
LKILIDIGHPAHVHLYKNFIREINHRGHSAFVSVKRNLISARNLLDLYNIPFIEIGDKSDSIGGKLVSQIKFDYQLYKFVRKNKIDIGLGSSITNAHVSRISKMESIIFDDDDDEVQPLFVKYAHPLCNSLLSPDVLAGKRKQNKTIYYPGYHELAYLHPSRFKPDPAVLEKIGLNCGERYFIMRFNVFKAHHDIGVKGLSLEQKLELINMLKPHGRIFITTEREIENELSEYQMNISPEKAHSLLAYATLLIGDSQTMTSEAAVLGVPSLRCNSFAGRISYLEEEEKKYGLTYAFLPEEFDKLKLKLTDLLQMDNLHEEWQKRRQIMLNNKIDVTGFMVWFVENYPSSIEILQKNPDFFQQFK